MLLCEVSFATKHEYRTLLMKGCGGKIKARLRADGILWCRRGDCKGKFCKSKISALVTRCSCGFLLLRLCSGQVSQE